MALPRTDTELAIWLNNFRAVLSQNSAALGVSEADLTSLAQDAAMFDYLVGQLVPAYKSAAQARVAYKDLIKNGPPASAPTAPPGPPQVAATPPLVAPGIVPRLRTLIQRIKLAPGYNDALGRDLGVTSPDDGGGISTDEAKPTAKAAALPDSQVRIEFVKGGFTGVSIESRRAAETQWTPLGVDNYSPYVDTRPPLASGQPEQREYRLRYLERDEHVGLYSDIINVSTTP